MGKTHLSREQKIVAIMDKVKALVASGIPPDSVIEQLPVEDYDYLIDHDISLDSFLLTEQQQENVKQLTRATRMTSPNGYNKKYPRSKQDLYNGIVAYIASIDGEIIPREKQNYRDLDFVLADTHYRIVLSNPRT